MLPDRLAFKLVLNKDEKGNCFYQKNPRNESFLSIVKSLCIHVVKLRAFVLSSKNFHASITACWFTKLYI